MVFPGKLSTGCHVCRRRKVKCDGVKPECQRCVKHGVKCTGYPEKFSFRQYKPPRKATTTDPASPQKSALTESSATSSPKTLRSINANSPSSSFSAISVTSEIQPSRGLPECADWQSICNFMNQVVLRVHRSPCKGYLAFMPDLFQEKGDDPCLKHAILSISYLTLSNKTGHQELHLKARKNHGLSLEHLNKALGSRENAVKDEILAACLLLSIFYNFVQDGGSLSDPHMSGICNLLQLRESEQVKTKYSRSLIGWSIVQIQSQAIGTNKFQYVKAPSFVETMPKPDCVLRAGILNSMLSQFCEVMSSLPIYHDLDESDRPKQNKILRSLLKRASYLITEIEMWHSCIPDHWREQYQPKSIDTDTLSAPRRPDPWTITFLATTHSAQIIFYTRTLSCYQMLQSLEPNFRMPIFSGNPAEFYEVVGGRITRLVNLICYTVSSLIGYPDANGTFQPASTANFANGNGLIWPIWAVITCSFSSQDQIAFCIQALDFIGQSLGHKLALSLSKQEPST